MKKENDTKYLLNQLQTFVTYILDTISSASNKISDNEMKILRYKLIDDKKFSEIAYELGLSAERIRQIYNRAIRRVLNYIRSNGLLLKENITLRQKVAVLSLEKSKSNFTAAEMKHVSLLQTRIEDCDFSVRVQNILRGAIFDGKSIVIVADLARMPKSEILKLRNIGKKSFSEINKFLKLNGLQFGMNT